MTTVDDVIARVNAVIQREVGYTSRTDPNRPASASPSKWSKYDQNGWHGYWCARGISTCVMNAIGVEAGRAVIGRQNGMIVGWAATWLWLDWIRANSPGYPGVRNCRTGDIMMMRFPSPSGGRSKNPTNHVEWVTGRYNNGVPAIGFNSVGPGGSGEPTAGGTVARQHRTGYIVGTYRLDWARAAVILGKAEPVRPPAPKPVAPTLKPPAQFKPYGRTTKQVQALVGVAPDGDYGPTTHRAVKAHQANLTEAGYSLGAPDGLWGRSTHTAQEAYMSDITALRDEVRKLAIVVNRIDKDTRIGVAAGKIVNRIDKAHQDVAARLDELNVIGPPAELAVLEGPAIPTAEEVAAAVWSRQLYGLAAHWYLRQGLVPNPEHSQYPADPGSPADLAMRVAHQVLGEQVDAYDGTQKRTPTPEKES